jgi:tripartite ATP-independent transporter DctM subunit
MEGHLLFLLLLFGCLFAAILSGMPAMFAIGGAPLLIAGIGISSGNFDPAFLHAFPQRVFGMMGNQLFIALPLFIFMGILMERAGLANGMLIAANRLAGHSKRGLGLSVLAVSALIAATTGIVGATIIMLGAISYPALIRAGITERLSSGLVISAGTLGQIIPPSIVLIILADQISSAYQEAQRTMGVFAIEPVTVSDVFAGALLPGLLLVGLYATYLFVVLDPKNQKNPTSKTMSDIKGLSDLSIGILLAPLFLIVSVLGSILFGIATPTEAAGIGAAGTLLLSGLQNNEGSSRRHAANFIGLAAFLLLGLAGFGSPFSNSYWVIFLLLIVTLVLGNSLYKLYRSHILQAVLKETIYLSGMIFGIILAASLLSLVFRGFGGDVLFVNLAASLPGEKWGALLFVMLIVFLLGFVLEFIEIIFIVVPIAAPILLAMNIDPVWLAVLFALNLQTSFLTPPFGVALFYFRSVAPPDLPTSEIYRAIVPFVLLQLVALGLVVLFPQIALFLPDALSG